MSNPTIIPLRVRAEPHRRRTEYFGTRAQLLEAGVIKAETMLPGDPGTLKTYHDYRQEGPGQLCWSWRLPKERFGVAVHFTQSEYEAADAADLRRERALEAKSARSDLERAVARWPTSHEAFRAQLKEWEKMGFGALRVAVSDPEYFGGYTFDSETREAVQLHLQAIRGLLAQGRTVFQPEVRARVFQDGRAKAASADHGFRSFIDSIALGAPMSRRIAQGSVALPGITKGEATLYFDVFIGEADAIVEAALARRDELPGKTGCGKTACSYLPDGGRAYRTGRAGHWKTEGFRRINKLSNGRFQVAVTVAESVVERRREAAKGADTVPARTSHLALVWSRP